jgi:hypothetical protein
VPVDERAERGVAAAERGVVVEHGVARGAKRDDDAPLLCDS